MYDWEYEEISDALGFTYSEGQLSRGDLAGLMASVDRLRAVDTAVRAVVAALPTSEAEPGIYASHSLGGGYCSCCDPVWDSLAYGYRHAPACPLAALVRLVAE